MFPLGCEICYVGASGLPPKTDIISFHLASSADRVLDRTVSNAFASIKIWIEMMTWIKALPLSSVCLLCIVSSAQVRMFRAPVSIAVWFSLSPPSLPDPRVALIVNGNWWGCWISGASNAPLKTETLPNKREKCNLEQIDWMSWYEASNHLLKHRALAPKNKKPNRKFAQNPPKSAAIKFNVIMIKSDFNVVHLWWV